METKNTEENYNFFTRRKKNNPIDLNNQHWGSSISEILIDTLWSNFRKYLKANLENINIKSNSKHPSHPPKKHNNSGYSSSDFVFAIYEKRALNSLQFLSLHHTSAAIFHLGTSLSQGQGFQLCPDEKRNNICLPIFFWRPQTPRISLLGPSLLNRVCTKLD